VSFNELRGLLPVKNFEFNKTQQNCREKRRKIPFQQEDSDTFPLKTRTKAPEINFLLSIAVLLLITYTEATYILHNSLPTHYARTANKTTRKGLLTQPVQACKRRWAEARIVSGKRRYTPPSVSQAHTIHHAGTHDVLFPAFSSGTAGPEIIYNDSKNLLDSNLVKDIAVQNLEDRSSLLKGTLKSPTQLSTKDSTVVESSRFRVRIPSFSTPEAELLAEKG